MIVVGAGVEGSATAYTLASTGKRNILLLEQVREKEGKRREREREKEREGEREREGEEGRVNVLYFSIVV